MPAIVVSAITHSTASPPGWRSLADSSAAVRRAIAIVCSSKDSRTPLRRPSMIGRTPIRGKELVMCWIFLFT